MHKNTLGALESLSKELVPNSPPEAASPNYRKSLALSLFYKASGNYKQLAYCITSYINPLTVLS